MKCITGDNMLKGVIFDMDGVLVDNTPIHIEAFDIFCRRYGIDDWRTKIDGFYGMGNDDIMSSLLPESIRSQKSLKEWGAEKEAVYREIYAPRIKPLDGLRNLLAELKADGIRCAVGSSACRENVGFVLEKCDIGEYFDIIVCGDDVTRCKPDPEIYLTAADRLGLRPSESIVFEDAKAGIEAGKKAGMTVIAVATSLSREILSAETAADAIINDFTEITVAAMKDIAMLNSR